MSYDLYFRSTGAAPTAEEFAAFFASRPRYEMQGNQAFYSNEDTGAYFAFERASPDAETDPEDPASGAWTSFNLNYGRPRYFLREAVLEIEALCREFRPTVFDPQAAAHSGPFDAALMAAAWSRTNAFFYDTIARRGAEPPAVEGDLLDALWDWNYHRDDLTQDRRFFVPKVQFLRRGGRLATFTVWSGGVPAAVPRTDVVVVVRPRPGPDGTVSDEGPIDRFLVPFSRVQPILAGLVARPKPVEHWVLTDGFDERVADEFFASLSEPEPDGSFEVISPDGIRDLGAAATPPARKSIWRRLLGG